MISGEKKFNFRSHLYKASIKLFWQPLKILKTAGLKQHIKSAIVKILDFKEPKYKLVLQEQLTSLNLMGQEQGSKSSRNLQKRGKTGLVLLVRFFNSNI